jgi:hypothetical protein
VSEPISEEDMLIADITRLSALYDSLCQTRHETGAKEYGVVAFLGNDVIRMMAEELADTSNYCRMQFIKLMLLQEMLETGLAAQGLFNEEGAIEMGAQAFKGTGEGWEK